MERLRPLVALALALGLGGCGAPAEEGGPDACSCEAGRPDLGPDDMDVSDLPLEDQGPADEGTACACSGVSTCCDGCQPRNALAWCHGGGDQYGRCGTTGGCNLGAPGAPITCAADACHIVNESALPSCVLVPANNGGTCNDGNATTFGDTCNAAGTCAGTTCVSSPPCIERSWNGTSCVSTPQTGDSCDDGNVSTYDDECQANGACEGTPCECTTGACCDGCFFRGTGHVCEAGRVVQTACGSGMGSSCGEYAVQSELADVYCSGEAATCSGNVVNRPTWVWTMCGAGSGCFEIGPGPTNASCLECS